MNKKTLAIILSIAMVIGAFAGLSFNLFSANAVEYVGDGTELVTDGNAPATAGDTVFFGTQKVAHFKTGGGTSQFNIGQDSVAGTDADGNGRYFQVAKIELVESATVTNVVLRNRIAFVATASFTAGQKYVASVKVKLPAGSTDTVKAQLTTCGTFAIQIAEPEKVVNSSDEVTLTTAWQEIKVVFDATADDKYYGLVLSTPAAVDVDSISIQKAVEENAPQYVGNGTEYVVNGDGAGAMNLNGSGTSPVGGSALTAVDGTDHGGNGKMFKSTPRTDNATGARWYFNSTKLTVTAGGAGKYIATVWVKVNTATTVIWGFDTVYGAGARPVFNVPANEWTKITTIAELDDVSVTEKYILGLFVNSDSAALDIYLDDISVQKATLATPTPETTPVPEATPVVGDGNELVLNGNANETTSTQISTSKGKSGGFWSKINGVSAKVPAVAYADKDGNGLAFSAGPRANNEGGLRAWFPDIQIAEGTYVFKFALKADSALDVKLAMKKGGYPSAADSLETYSITAGDWTEYTYVLELTETAADNKYCLGFLTNDATSNATTFYIDAISLQAAAVASAPEEVVGNGIEMVTDGKAPATAGDTVYLGGQKIAHFKTAGGTTQFNIGQDSVAGTDADGNGRYFAVAKIALTDSEASNSALRNKLPFFMTIDGFTAGKQYVVSAYVKLPAGATGTVTAQLATCSTYAIQLAGGSEYHTHASDVVTLTNEWQKITLVIDYEGAGDGIKGIGDKYLGLALNTPAAVDIDSISIQQVGTPVDNTDKYTENLFVKHGNGSFNKGDDIAPLYATETTKWAVDIVSTDSQDNDGKCALVSARGYDYVAPRAKATDIIKAYGAGKYTFSAYIKATGADITLQPVIQMVWGEAYNNDNLAAGLTVGSWKTGTTEVINGTAWKKISVEFEIDSLTKLGAKGDTLELKEVLCYAKDMAFNALFAEDVLVDNLSLIKEINGQENADLIAQLSGGAANEGGNSNAGSSNTGDVLPVALIAVVAISAGALVVVARRKREE